MAPNRNLIRQFVDRPDKQRVKRFVGPITQKNFKQFQKVFSHKSIVLQPDDLNIKFEELSKLEESELDFLLDRIDAMLNSIDQIVLRFQESRRWDEYYAITWDELVNLELEEARLEELRELCREKRSVRKVWEEEREKLSDKNMLACLVNVYNLP